jgi:hypothetical protein
MRSGWDYLLSSQNLGDDRIEMLPELVLDAALVQHQRRHGPFRFRSAAAGTVIADQDDEGL